MNVLRPCVTFDQPLWYKASGIIAKKKLNIIYPLGVFYTSMSFLGDVGDMMSGSGTEELLELVYAANSVGHMMSGKAFAWTIRGYFFVGSCLSNILIKKIVKEENNPEDLEHIDCLEWVHSNCTKRAADVSETIWSANATTWLNQKLEQEKQVDRDIQNSTIMG